MFGEAIRGLEQVRTTLDQLARTDFAAASDPDLHAFMAGVAQASSRLQAVLTAATGEWDARQLWVRDGATSGQAWLRAHGEMEHTKPLVETAGALRDHAPATSKALAEGSLSYEKAVALASAVTPEVADAFAADEASLLRAAGRLTVAETKKVAAHWRQAAEADLDGDPHDKARARRTGRMWKTRDGLLGIEAFLDPDLSPAIKAGVEARVDQLWHADVREAKAAAGLDPTDDNHLPDGVTLARTGEQRMADALGELLLLGSGARGKARETDCIGGPSAHLHLMVPADVVIHAAAERVRRTLAIPGIDGDEREALEAALATLSPKHPARRLLDGPVPALDGWDTPPDEALVGLLACDCTLSRVILDAAGLPLDVGRAYRLATPAQRRALIARDRGCAFPGCDRPPGWCDVHHIIPYELKGLTNLANLVLLCRRHHRLLHGKRPWRCWINPATRLPEFFRPDGTPMPKPALQPRPGAQPGAPPNPNPPGTPGDGLPGDTPRPAPAQLELTATSPPGDAGQPDQPQPDAHPEAA